MTIGRVLLSLLPLVFSACSAGGDGAECSAPALDEDTLNRLAISPEIHLSLKPGDTFEFQTGTSACCYTLTPVTTCATWSVSPAGAGATVSGDGVFELDSSAASGDVFEVTAVVEGGRAMASATVYVYEPEVDPLVGRWTETAQLACQTGEEVAPEQPIQELRFEADRAVRVTWAPEVMRDVDYRGVYLPDPNSGAIDMEISYGMYLPADVDLDGTFSIEADELTLRDIWLGTPPQGTQPARCGHRFSRQ